ncbi:MAG: Formate dehydrogenase regulator [Pseudomonadota bacterium]|jgi:molybdate transport repressor ModE-like protein
MFKVRINPHWEIAKDQEEALDTAVLLSLLRAIEETGSIARAAEMVDLSYRYAWGILRNAETLFGHSLMETGRGRGTNLSKLAEKLIWADRRVNARLSPTLDSLASELETELEKMIGNPTKQIRLDASHGFAVAAFLRQASEVGLQIDLHYRNSNDAVASLSRGEADLAGFHVPLGEFQTQAMQHYGKLLNGKTHQLIHLAVRVQGLFVNPGNPLGIKNLHDLIRSDVRFVNRQVGSGTRMLLELMLHKIDISPTQIIGYENTEFTHSAVAAFIASGMADVGIGVQTAAARFKLDFIPLLKERYFFALPSDSLGRPEMQQVIEVMCSEAFRSAVNQLPGYDASETGTILTLEQAFGATR